MRSCDVTTVWRVSEYSLLHRYSSFRLASRRWRRPQEFATLLIATSPAAVAVIGTTTLALLQSMAPPGMRGLRLR
jgi:hypothetical protein